MKEDKVRKIVREGYAEVAKKQTSCCDTSASCGCSTAPTSEELSSRIGYSKDEMNSVPEGANLGLGCGNPIALASLKEGETVLDLGSGAGFDVFLAANKVGKSGKVIGVDMTSEMLDKARENARKGKYGNVEFRLGEIENLPAPDNSVDVVISNCVINLSPNKKKVFGEAFRVLKPNGRLMVSDIVLLKELPEAIRKNIQAYIGCVAGAEMKNKYLRIIEDAGFRKIKVIEESVFPIDYIISDPTALKIIKDSKIPAERIKETTSTVVSIKVSAFKPN
jgi:ubiquinone/menaquinone biosynthesis C-methylase UbiE